MMQQMIYFLKKSFLYLTAMGSALALTYFVGLAPLLKAQTPTTSAVVTRPAANANGPLDPDLPDVSASAPQALQKQPQTSLSPSTNSGSNNLAVPVQGVQGAPSSPSTMSPGSQNSAPLSAQKPDPALGPIILFKHTKSYIGEISSPERDPFRKPMYLLEIEERAGRPKLDGSSTAVDDRMEAIRRWPLREYKLIGVIWDVQSPKAMILDPSNTMHLLKRNYRIGDRDGVISSISEGNMTVIQDNVPVVVDITKKSN